MAKSSGESGWWTAAALGKLATHDVLKTTHLTKTAHEQEEDWGAKLVHVAGVVVEVVGI
jgi:hypothetical protein